MVVVYICKQLIFKWYSRVTMQCSKVTESIWIGRSLRFKGSLARIPMPIPTFPMEFFNEIWLKVGEHEYINIFEIKFEKHILYKNGDQNKFSDIAQYR